MAASGTSLFAPSVADLIVECFARIQIYAPELQTQHIVEARRSSNLILSDWSANRGVNLWAVEPIHMALQAGRTSYFLPDDTIQLLDVYIRTFPADLDDEDPFELGNTLTPIAAGGIPVVSVLGDPAVLAPGSGTLTSTKDSQTVGLRWPAHGLKAGDPILFPHIASIGGLVLTGLFLVDFVADQDTIFFNARDPAVETQLSQGATPLLQTTEGDGQVVVIYSNHGMREGDTFSVWDATIVGGLILFGDYRITSIWTPYQFTIQAVENATSSDSVFIKNGVIEVIRQTTVVNFNDRIMTGLSRSEYAAIPQKTLTGVTNTFWYDRIIPPTLAVWPVPSTSDQFGLIAYRMRQLQDLNPVSGQTPDMPNRFLPAFTAELTAALAEKFQPTLFKDKAAIALDTWPRAAQEDRELVPLYILPGIGGYYL